MGVNNNPARLSKMPFQLTATRPKGQTVTINVAARGPEGTTQQGPWTEKSVALRRR